MPQRFAHLLSPGRIGQMETRNRIVHAPMSLSLGAGDGSCGEAFLAYYERRARGGVGLINIGTVSVGYPEGAVDAKQIAISDDRFIPGIAELAERVQRHGARIMLQLNHNGPMAGYDRANGRPVAVPSPPIYGASSLLEGYLPEELEELAALAAANRMPPDPGVHVLDFDDIARIVQMYARAAGRAKRAGVDAVEIHGGHGYLLQNFLSAASNRRTDAYGGPIANRVRFLLEVVRACRAEVGPVFPIVAKLDAVEFGREGGLTPEESLFTARAARKAGADAITATAYADMGQPLNHSGAHTPDRERLLVPYAERVRAEIGGPVMTAGRIELVDADADIAAGRYDFVALGRKLLADPDLARRLAEGEPGRVRPCIYCYVCLSQAYFRRPIRCAVNPEMGHEQEPAPPPAIGHIVVLGAGLTGLEVARRLAERGARVSLIERGPRVGGQAIAAAAVMGPNGHILDWLVSEIDRLGVTVHTDIGDPIALAQTSGAARLIDCTRITPPAADGSIDATCADAVAPLGNAVTIIGADATGLGLARLHARSGRRVTVFDSAAKPGRGVALVRRWRLLSELEAAGVKFRLGLDSDVVVEEARATGDCMIDARTAAGRTILEAFEDAARIAAEIGEEQPL